MDTITAQGILQSLITQKQSELDALTLALSVLNETFAADMTAITAAQTGEDEARAAAATLTAEAAAQSAAPAEEAL